MRDVARNVETNQLRLGVHAGHAQADGAPHGGRAEEVRGRPVDELPGLPGAARPGRRPALRTAWRCSTTTSRWWISRPSRKRRPPARPSCRWRRGRLAAASQ
ncbi:MAG: hypothetical protein MZU84_04395 [Sphingobacterium sp.]|nr:hypothetical protein [Sphingobacterium sp.]